jgi:hypothetical protein
MPKNTKTADILSAKSTNCNKKILKAFTGRRGFNIRLPQNGGHVTEQVTGQGFF